MRSNFSLYRVIISTVSDKTKHLMIQNESCEPLSSTTKHLMIQNESCQPLSSTTIIYICDPSRQNIPLVSFLLDMM